MRIRLGAVGAFLMTVGSGAVLIAAAPQSQLQSAPESRVRFGHAVAVSGAVSAAGTAQRSGAQDTTPVYLEIQADSGSAVFTRVCVECHEKVDVNGPDFRAKWSGQSVFALFERIRTSMPDSDPGSLPREEYLNVVAYLLKLNGIPSGETPMATDSTALAAAILSLPPVGGNQ